MKSQILLCLLLGASPALAQQESVQSAAETPASAAQEQAWDAPLAKGMDLMRAGQSEAAIREVFDPVIASFEQKYVGDKRKVYCIRTPTEALLYMSGAASNKQDAVALQPTWAYAWFMKSYALSDLGRREEALVALQKALDLSPNNPQFLSELGYTHIADRDWPSMLEVYDNAEAMVDIASPDDLKTEELTRALRGQGYALTEMGKYDEAEARYRKALRADPNDEKSKGELEYIAGMRKKATAQSPGK